MKFKLFGRLQDKDQEGEEGGSKRDRGQRGESIPQEKIESMSRRGLSENEIRDELRDAGYSHKQIDDALNQTVKRNAISGSRDRGGDYDQGGGRGEADRGGELSHEFGQSTGPASGQDTFSPFSGSQEEGGEFSSDRSRSGDLGDVEGTGGGGGFSGGQEQERGGLDYAREGGDYSQEEISAEGVPSNARELIEIMVAEELSDIDERFDQINNRMGKLEESVSSLKEQVDELSARREEDEKEFLKRIKDMEGYLKESQSTVGGLKKTMQEVLPALSHNIKEMNKVMEEKKED